MALTLKRRGGPTPDTTPMQLSKLRQQYVNLSDRRDRKRTDIQGLLDAARDAAYAALTEPSDANTDAKAAAWNALNAARAELSELDEAITIAQERIAQCEAEATSNNHKRELAACERNLTKRDTLASEVTDAATKFLTVLHQIREANIGGYSAKPYWPNESDNEMGLGAGAFELKLAHELFRLCTELEVQWPEARIESAYEDISTKLADRLRVESVNVMERMRKRPIVGVRD